MTALNLNITRLADGFEVSALGLYAQAATLPDALSQLGDRLQRQYDDVTAAGEIKGLDFGRLRDLRILRECFESTGTVTVMREYEDWNPSREEVITLISKYAREVRPHSDDVLVVRAPDWMQQPGDIREIQEALWAIGQDPEVGIKVLFVPSKEITTWDDLMLPDPFPDL